MSQAVNFKFQLSNTSDIELLSQHIVTTMEQLQQQLKLVKRRIPPEMDLANLGLNKELSENLYHCYQQSGKVMKTLQDIVKHAVQMLSASGGKENILNLNFYFQNK